MKKKDYTGHIGVVARELNTIEDICLKSLVSLGIDIYKSRILVRVSSILWNLVDSWYRNKVYELNGRRFIEKELMK
ncbi:MAG: hypothetical protein J7K21_07495 [Desulfurococcales archaeon]|nr:hypothetical protein [Desulfurococcales archaeon]